jgi:hypothetical protein
MLIHVPHTNVLDIQPCPRKLVGLIYFILFVFVVYLCFLNCVMLTYAENISEEFNLAKGKRKNHNFWFPVIDYAATTFTI